METADHLLKIEDSVTSVFSAASRFAQIGLLISCAFILPVISQQTNNPNELKRAEGSYDNGNYDEALILANKALIAAKKKDDSRQIILSLEMVALAQIRKNSFEQAATSLNEALNLLTDGQSPPIHFAPIHLAFADLSRAQRNHSKVLEYSKKALATQPNSRKLQAEHHLNVGRFMFNSGFDVSAIIWLEKAERLFELLETSPGKLDTYRFLSLAWSSKLNYSEAQRYSKKAVALGEKTRFKYRFRQVLFELGTLYSSTGQQRKSVETHEMGLKFSLADKNPYHTRLFISSLLMKALFENEVQKASKYAEQLENLDMDGRFAFDIKLGKAIVFAYNDQGAFSDSLFKELEVAPPSPFSVPSWRLTIAEKNKDWDRVIKLNEELLSLALKENFQEDLPPIYLSQAKANFHLNRISEAGSLTTKAIALIEQTRDSKSQPLSLALVETYHQAYRLLAQLSLGQPEKAFQLSDFLKGRLLKDRIEDSPVSVKPLIAPDVKKRLEALSSRLIDDPTIALEVAKEEALITTSVPSLELVVPALSDLETIDALKDVAIVSYFFSVEGKLRAFVWEKGRALRMVDLLVSEHQLAEDAKLTQQKIKERIFFKKDGKELYDKLIKPLVLNARHIVFVPDKHLWKIPFQALSPDGERYLIEDSRISYAPSVAVLKDQLKADKRERHTLQAFANQSYDDRSLRYVNKEAASVARLFNSKPILNATVPDFLRFADKADILHFSMHAQVDNDQPLESFMGFRGVARDDGRLTVEELLDVKLRKGCLVFVASCDTNNVLSGEGLVSIAWGMMGSGASTVISAQWEANDRSTEIFTGHFYRFYRKGASSAEAIQKASVEMIKDKSGNFHEPYYWAAFTLNGDFR